MAAITDGELGAQHRSQHRSVVRPNPELEAAPGDGLSLLSGHHSPGAAVLCATHGSRGGTGAARQGLSLSEREVDLEELAGPGSPPLTHDNVRGAEYFDQGGPTSC